MAPRAEDLPSLHTARLRLYPPRLEDLEARLAMDRDPEVMRYIRPIPENIEAHRTEVREKILGLGGPAGTAFHYGRDLPFYRLTRADYLAGS